RYKIRKMLQLPYLKHLFISPSHQCNANCTHCYESFPGKQQTSMTTEEVKLIVDEFADMGGLLVYFCSGEFLMRSDAIELIWFTHDMGLKVTVTTNGSLLTETKIQQLKEAGLDKLVVSLDSAVCERHDHNRNMPGLFDSAIKGLKRAKEVGLETQVWSYISHSNLKELGGIADLNSKIATWPVFVFFPLLSGRLFNHPEENLTFAEREREREKFNDNPQVALEFQSESDVCRGGGYEHLNITPEGEVTFCPPVPYSYGNIKKESLSKILMRAKKDWKRYMKKGCTGQCIVNFKEYREYCNAKPLEFLIEQE
ncbi:MAG: radical SAM protein, partial [Bacteroidetes bacterium]|nr:radical SAM protein [Bacteroidota bacterium]